MNERKSECFPEHNVKVVQAGDIFPCNNTKDIPENIIM